jgi:riboflavin synthase
MFTGIVEELGVVVAVEPHSDAARLTIGCEKILDDVVHGASIAVNGVCLTVTSSGAGSLESPEREGLGLPEREEQAEQAAGGSARSFTADVMKETLDRSSLGGLTVGEAVNLERSVRLLDRLGGHLVQGHVDGVGVVTERHSTPRWDVVTISVPAPLERYMVEKGSVTVDGVSLTVVDVAPAAGGETASFRVSLIPTTLVLTTLGRRAVGDKVNIEVDILAKYIEKLHAASLESLASLASTRGATR